MEEIKELVNLELNKPNFLIEDNNSNSAEKYAVIYFSSMGLYGFDDPVEFRENIIGKNKFEFYKTRINKASRHIFVRDLNKDWYLSGINNEINSFEKFLNFLKEQTSGYKIITIGSSAGGYAAALFGILLNAEYVFAYSAQFSISSNTVPEYKKTIDLIKNSNIPIFYMLPSNCGIDEDQWKMVSDIENVYYLKIKSIRHGVPIIRSTLSKIINAEPQKLYKMYNKKTIGEPAFLLKHYGIISLIQRVVEKNFKNKKVNS